MPPKKIKFVCKDLGKRLPQGEIWDQPGNCFRKGIRVGFVAGLRKATAKQAKIRPILQELKNNPPRLRPVPKKKSNSIPKPSLKALIDARPNKTTTKARDFLTTLPIRNKELQKTTKEKKAMSTEGLKKYLIDTKEYVE
jgi:hypothetical protein